MYMVIMVMWMICNTHSVYLNLKYKLYYILLYWRIYLQFICYFASITFVSVSLWSVDSLCCAHIGVSSVEIKTEADHNDLTECSHDDKPSTGMFAVYFISIFCVSCMLLPVGSKNKLLEYSLCLFVCFVVK